MFEHIDFSWLRALGLMISLISFIVFFKRLRHYQEDRGLDWLLAVSSLAIGAVSLWPGLASLPAEIFHLDTITGGRIITLLLFASLFTWVLLLKMRTKQDKLSQQLASLIQYYAVNQIQLDNTSDTHQCILVLMPAFNEADNLPHVLPTIPQTLLGLPVISVVIDDCSFDDTYCVAKQYSRFVLKHPINCGQGLALRTGYLLAKALQPKVIVTMDTDGQHQAKDIETLIRPILNNQADVVIGSRRLGNHIKTPGLRKLGIHFFSYLVSKLIHQPITDCSSGFRAFRYDVIQSLTLKQPQNNSAELIIEAGKRRFQILEQPITITPRIFGESKKGRDLIYGLHFFNSILRTWLR